MNSAERTTTVRFPKRLHKELKIAATQSELSIQAFVERLFTRYRGEGTETIKPERPPAMSETVGQLPASEREIVRTIIALMRDRANPGHRALLNALRAVVELYTGARQAKNRRD